MSNVASSRGAPHAANVRRGRRLEYLTIAWNSLEAVAAIGAGFLAGSIGLGGFVDDSSEAFRVRA